MDVFSLRQRLISDYSAFARSFTDIHAIDIKEGVEAEYASGRYWPEPLIQINPRYAAGRHTSELVVSNELLAQTGKCFNIPLYQHQEQAIAHAAKGDSFVVTTGTGSGKSLCFFLPIADSILRARQHDSAPRTRAIVIYPMNALANSQREELDKFIGKSGPVSFARYTGQESAEERERIQQSPPDILLTNFMMLELLMTRQGDLDRKVIENCEGLQFLVLDELHTYRGRQGADVAMLVRRVRERLAPEGLQCIGTSATMASGGTSQERNAKVAEVASTLFATDIPAFNVITEDLERATDPSRTADSVRAQLPAAVDTPVPERISDAELRMHPLAIWVETRLGIARTGSGKWERARPLTEQRASELLQEESGRPLAACRHALQQLLLIAAIPESQRPGREGGSNKAFFAFRLHQFISGAGTVYTTLESPGHRPVELEGQQFLPAEPTKRLYSAYFCRNCGQEYHPVRWQHDAANPMLLSRDIDDMPVRQQLGEDDVSDAEADSSGERQGFVTMVSATLNFGGNENELPESWFELTRRGELRLRKSYAALRPEPITVTPDGQLGAGAPAWFLPGKFRLCLRCGESHGAQGKDNNRLAALSAEGRSSATTLLTSSMVRWMHEQAGSIAANKRKLLGFTDNRQDAALQVGHFNDSTFVSVLRGSVYRALQSAADKGLTDSDIGACVRSALGFDRILPSGVDPATTHRAEWLQDPSLQGVDLKTAEETLRFVLAYRTWYDQRRGWRYTNPNLEELGLLAVEYLDLEAFCANDTLFRDAPPLLHDATPEYRRKAFEALFDYMRRGLAVDAAALDPLLLTKHRDEALRFLREPWSIGREERLLGWRWLFLDPPSRQNIRGKDEELILRSGLLTLLGKTLRKSSLWNNPEAVTLGRDAYRELIEAMVRAAQRGGFIRAQEQTPFNMPGLRLNAARIRFSAGVGKAEPRAIRYNPYFANHYAAIAHVLGGHASSLFSLEAREHTAQVEQDLRQLREARFRFEEKEQQYLEGEGRLRARELGESSRFLPVMFCSPTMELGVDIAALNTVYLRNVPPTPANYVQRAGRAGRSGQAALVVTYCAARSPHDQYFFRDPRAMVHGVVRAPMLDLANQELIQSHLQAIWLASSGQHLDSSISRVLDASIPRRPVSAELMQALGAPEVAAEAQRRSERVLEQLKDHLTAERAPWYPGAAAMAQVAIQAAQPAFDAAFKRWRDLFEAAERQKQMASATLGNYAITDHRERNEAKRRLRQAIDQIELLLHNGESRNSDFYTYRYLATQGFLPGYNFPRLPLMAYVPGRADGKGGSTFLQRPRFLALSEFGPRSLVYHEGRAYRVVRVRIAPSGHETVADANQLPSRAVRICTVCGAAHFDQHSNACHACGATLADAQTISSLYRIENVDTEPAERITANDEERQRQAFELQTTFQWNLRNGVPDVRTVGAADTEGGVLRLHYGPGATITRINKGLRRRRDQSVFGFWVNPRTGWWQKSPDEDGGDPAPDQVQPQRIVPYVEDQKNALLLQPQTALSETTLVTLQHALKRGIEAQFQLEEAELLAEPLPDAKHRTGVLFYEATEGGAGVLTRLASDPDVLAQVARRALAVMHYNVLDDDDQSLPTFDALHDVEGTTCVAGCYRCLLSYYNQPDHPLIDRRDSETLRILWRLAQIRTELLTALPAPLIPEKEPEVAGWGAQWQQHAARLALPVPSRVEVDSISVLHWPDRYAAIALPDTPRELQAAWEDRGYTFVRFVSDTGAWPAAMQRLARLLGVSLES